MSLHTEVSNEEAMENLAGAIAPLLAAGDILLLSGGLGAGKTVFARALIRTLAGNPDLTVPSPTFTLLQTYDADGTDICHFDLYRLDDPEEVYELGWDDITADSVVLVEWPERLGHLIPADSLAINFAVSSDDESARRLTFVASGPWQTPERLSQLTKVLKNED